MEVSPRYTLLYTVHTAYTVYMVCTAYCVILLKQYHVCLYILLAKVTTLLEWADGLMSKMLDGLDG